MEELLTRNNETNEFIWVYSREGNFNWANPSEKSISTHIAICTSNDKERRSVCFCNITTEEKIDNNYPDIIIHEINSYLNRYWIISDSVEVKRVRDYIIKNKYRLEYGNAIHEYNINVKKEKELAKKLYNLECDILDYEEENSKFVNGAWISAIK